MSRRFDNRMQYGNPRSTPPPPGYRNMRPPTIPYQSPPMVAPYPPNNRAFTPQQPLPPQQQPPFQRGEMMPPNGGKNGLLSKLFKKQKNNNAMPANPFSLPSNSARNAAGAAAATASAATGGGIIQNLINPANLTTMLNNTQSVLQAAESLTPYVQQYGPLIKNIPAMWKAYRGLQSENENSMSTQPTMPMEEPPMREHMIRPEPHMYQEQVMESSIQDLKPIRIKPRKPKIKPTVVAHSESSSSHSRHVWRKGESTPKLFI